MLFKNKTKAHTVYISSDAVYADPMYRLSENSPLGAQNSHGMMHAMREVMLKDATNQICPLAILRPTLIYGDEDPTMVMGQILSDGWLRKVKPLHSMEKVRN